MELGRALEIAIEAALAAGEILRADFHRATGPRGGGDKAEADLEAEQVVRARLQAAFPEWSYRGEETGYAPGIAGQPIWLVDPNDGTRDYLRGRRGSAVSIGLVQRGRPLLGVVHPFAYPDDAGELFAWAEGRGPVRRNGNATAARLPTVLGAEHVVLVSSRGDRDPENNLACVAPARYRPVPSIAHRLALVASGEGAATSALFEPCAWDYAAGHALLRAVGGEVVDQDGQPVGYADDGHSKTRAAFAGSLEAARELSRRPWRLHGRSGSEVAGAPVAPGPGLLIADAARLGRAHGCLLGQLAAVGQCRDSASPLAGPAGRLPGQQPYWGESALVLARSIAVERAYDAHAVDRARRTWLDSVPRDTAAAAATERDAGCIVRTSSLVLYSGLGGDAARLTETDCAAAHDDPPCRAAVSTFAAALDCALAGGEPNAIHAAAVAHAEDLDASLAAALRSAVSRETFGDERGAVSSRAALAGALSGLVSGVSFAEAVHTTVRQGDRAVPQLAALGALYGAASGRGVVPDAWRLDVQSCRPLKGPSRRPASYWPADVFELAERLLVVGRGSRSVR